MAITKIQANAFPATIDLSGVDLTIGTGEIATTNLADSAVSSAKLASAVITPDKLADSAVHTSKLASSSITTPKIADNAIHTAKIAATAVTHDKLHTDMNLTSKTVVLPDMAAFNFTSGNVGIGTDSANTPLEVVGTVTATSYIGDGSSLTGINTDLVSDTTPQLGGNLDLNSSNITGTGNVNITGTVTATSFSGDGSSLSGINTDLVDDTTPQLGGNLDLNSSNITGTGNVNITGTVTATSFSGDGSSLTGIESLPDAISVNGSAAASTLNIDASSNVGIGTTAPDEWSVGSSYKVLSVGGNGSAGIVNLVDNGTAGSYLQFGNSTIRRASIHAVDGSDVVFTLNSTNSGTALTERVRFTNDGNVGIGTNAPGEKLHIKSSGNAYKMLILEAASGTGDAGLLLQGQNGNQFNIQQPGSSAGLFFYDRTNSAYRMYIDGSGNVGIATNNPSYTLHVNGPIVASGGDGGAKIGEWTNNSAFAMFGTANMTGSEYAIISDGTNTYVSAGASGNVSIRGGNNDSDPQIQVTGSEVNIRKVTSTEPDNVYIRLLDDSTEKGVIGTGYGDDPYIAKTGGGGLRFSSSSISGSNDTGTIVDNAYDLGQSNYRFRTGYFATDVRAPIFYDVNNTGYYIHADNTSNLNKLQVQSRHVLGHYQDVKHLGNFAASATQAIRHTIGRVYFCPNHWGDWTNIRVILQEEGYTQSGVEYDLYGWYGIGNGNSLRLDTKKINGLASSDYRLVLGTVTDSGWDYSGQNVYYQDVYLDVDYYRTVRVTVATETSGISGSNPSSGTGWAYVFYDSPSSANISAFGHTHEYLERNARVNTASFKAPIFYDNDNTNYYVDPAGASILQGLKLDDSVNNSSGTDAVLWIYRDNNNDWGQIIDADNGSATDYGLRIDCAASNSYALQIRGGGTEHFKVNSDYAFHHSDMRSPIFYDSNNTNYYIHGDGESSINSLKTAGTVLIGGSYGNNHYNSVSSTRLTFGGGNDINNYFIGTNMENYGGNYTKLDLRWHTGIRMGAQQGYGGVRIFDSEDLGTVRFSVAKGDANTRVESGSFYSNIMYDRDNTSYYVDPHSYSSLYGVAIRGDVSSTAIGNQIFFWSTGGTTTSAIGFKSNGGNFTNPTGNGDGYNTYLSMDTVGRGWVFRRATGGSDFSAAYTSGWILNNGIWQANASMRSPIFYDSNNTAYYFDGHSTGDSIRVAGDIVAYYSDARLKDFHGRINNALDKVLKINGYYYTENETAKALGYNTGRTQVGVSAQEVEEVLPEVIKDAPIGHGYKTVQYERMIPLLLEAIKELKEENDELKARLDAAGI